MLNDKHIEQRAEYLIEDFMAEVKMNEFKKGDTVYLKITVKPLAKARGFTVIFR